MRQRQVTPSKRAPSRKASVNKASTKHKGASSKASKKTPKRIKKSAPKRPNKNLKVNVSIKIGTKVTKKTKPVKKVTIRRVLVKKAAPIRIPAQPKTVAAGPKGYTADQYVKFQSEKKRLQDFNNAKLKEILKSNMQSMTGNKDDLIQKIADGIVLGRIPKCPTCFGGRPKFNYKTGTYHCSGYHDDDEFKNCHTNFQLHEIKRDPWQ